MGRQTRLHIWPILLLQLLAAAVAGECFAQSKSDGDSIVWLLNAKSAQVLDPKFGGQVRKVIGPATFLHNDTYLKCDTAFWYVDREYIDAWGNVSIIQDKTVLTSEKMHYLVDESLAQFRGAVVELKDKDNNILRTKYLNYNTKDSVAVFRMGGSMKDKDGNIIESLTGEYDAKSELFKFKTNVNMFTDSIFVRTYWMNYYSDADWAEFGGGVDAWKDTDMLSSEDGWYRRKDDLFLFRDRVHVLSEKQEGWSDSLYFNKAVSSTEMLGNVQVTDDEQRISAVGGRLKFINEPRNVTMTRSPAIIMETSDEDGTKDTLYFAADTLIYDAVRKCDIDSVTIADAVKRKESITVDAIRNLREKNRKAAEQKKNQGQKPQPKSQPKAAEDSSAQNQTPSDTTATLAQQDSSLLAGVDSSTVVIDTLAPIADTTLVNFVTALRNVRIYRSDLQAVCDSMVYSDLDSLVRMFLSPIIWNEVKNQFSSDSVFMVLKDQKLTKVSFLNNAFIHNQEDTIHYNQIKGMEMMAYFNDASKLSRFDALGGASAVFYLKEEERISLVNQKECKLLSAELKDGEIKKIHYYENVRNDIHPISQITLQNQRLKGFDWQEQKRPATRMHVTDRQLRTSERGRYLSKPTPQFKYTDLFYPGYIDGIRQQIHLRDSLRKVAELERLARQREQEDSLKSLRGDSLDVMYRDSLARIDSLRRFADSLAFDIAIDTSDFNVNFVTASIDEIDILKDRASYIDRLGDVDYDQLPGVIASLEEDLSIVKARLKDKGLSSEQRRELRYDRRSLRKEIRVVKRHYRKQTRQLKN